MTEPTPVQLQILRQRYPGIGEPALRRNFQHLLNPTGIGTAHPLADPAGPITSIEEARKRIRQHQGDGMNGWEREYFQRLSQRSQVRVYRPVTLPLANNCAYKVDFLCYDLGQNVVEGHEVKGQRRSTGIVKIKVAAREFPWIKFYLATKRRKRDGGGWDVQEILP